jgi:hypothetical protein
VWYAKNLPKREVVYMYRTIHVVRHVIPDGRLVHAKIEDGVVEFAYRAWRIEPVLVQAMGLLSSRVAAAGIFDLDPAGGEPALSVWFEAADIEPLMDYRVGQFEGMPPFFELWVRKDHIDPAMVRELNEEVMPLVCGALVPVLRQPDP